MANIPRWVGFTCRKGIGQQALSDIANAFNMGYSFGLYHNLSVLGLTPSFFERTESITKPLMNAIRDTESSVYRFDGNKIVELDISAPGRWVRN